MSTRTKDMTVGTPGKLIFLFCLPIIVGNMFQQFYSLVDTLVVGRVEGVTALAAVSSAGWLDWCVLSLAMGLAQGFAIEIAQRFGAGDHAGLRRAAGQSLLLALAGIVVIEVLVQSLLRPILTLLQTPAETFTLTELYLRILFGGLALMMGFNLFSGFLRSVGDSRTPLIAMTTAALCNIGLDILFVAVFRWGVAGVAIATVLSQGISCTICLIALTRLPVMRITRSDLRPDPACMRRLMSLGLPIALQNATISIGGLVLQGVVNGFGFIFMAGYSAASRLQGLVEVMGVSLSAAITAFSGQNMGAGRLDRVKKGLRHSLLIGLAMSALIATVIAVFGRGILSLFVEDDPAIVEQVLTFGHRFLLVMSAGLPGLYVLFVYRSTLQGMGDTFIPMLSGVAELVMRIGCALLLPLLIGEWGVYIAEISAWIGAAILLCCGYYYRLKHL